MLKSLFLDLSITNGIVSTIIYDKRDVFCFEIFIFPFLDGDVSRSPSSVYIFHSLFVLREYVLMLVTSTTETNFDGLKLFKQFAKHFLNSTTDTQTVSQRTVYLYLNCVKYLFPSLCYLYNITAACMLFLLPQQCVHIG